MKYEHPLKKILSLTRPYWDRDETLPSVRLAFSKTLQCRTAALGAEVYASDDEELVLYHTCKSVTCPSCGHRRNVQWLRERWAALPNVLYKGITFTMPRELWALFRDNPKLAKALSALAAKVIQTRVSAKFGLRIGVIAILHTFNGKLEFNSHVHAMLTGGGLRESSGTWDLSVYHDSISLMKAWRSAVVKLLRVAGRAGELATTMTVDQLEDVLNQQQKRHWRIKIQSLKDRTHFLQYAGRYVRRPPIAQRRITLIDGSNVVFWFKDKKLRRLGEMQCSLEDFIDRWSQHVPERYQHAVRNFGLFAPRALGKSSAAIFAILGQRSRLRPKARSWAESIKKDFNRDPLLDHTGKRMKWIRRIAPKLLAN
jgi:Putative transposase/Transposase zinc-binding domain